MSGRRTSAATTAATSPPGVGAYAIDTLAEDVVGLIEAAGREQVHIVGHDWGAAVAWWVAGGTYPERVKKLAILNVPHPAVMQRTVWEDAEQRKKSWYIFFFQLPWLPETSLSHNGFTNAIRALKGSSRRGTFTDDDLAAYRQAWSQPGAITAMLNWYRAAVRNQGQASRSRTHHRAHADDLGRQGLCPGPRDGAAEHRPVRRWPAGLSGRSEPLGAARGAGGGQPAAAGISGGIGSEQ